MRAIPTDTAQYVAELQKAVLPLSFIYVRIIGKQI